MRRALVFLAAMALLSLPRPVSALTHFGLVDTGELFVSQDGGASWAILATLPVRDATALIAGASASELFLAARSGSFYKSSDAGMSWSAISAVPASDLVALVPYPGRLLLFSRSGSVFGSLDGGASFSATGTLIESDLAGAARLGASVFAVSRNGSVFGSSDAGATWSAVGTLPVSNAVAMAAFLDRLYVLTETGDLARSADLGASWSFVSTLSQSGMTSLLASSGELLAASAAGEVAASANGLTWTWRGAINQLTVTALASDQPNPTAVGLPEPGTLATFALASNPARGEATLVFDLDRESVVTVEVHDVSGRQVALPLAGERVPAGRVIRAWWPQGLASGLYFVRARVAGNRWTLKLALLR
jgi:hypothetical protein